ncbi:MAG TPA: class I SAM-dependent methyltransferase [Baekduia sp.]|nr:class I SAM-dependent methyltransferase [Baekduia sp.]
MDWGLGEYERTARELAPAAAVAIDALRPHSGQRVLDVACGTGNAALLAAAKGATVTGVDASKRLLEVAAQRARTEALEAEWQVAELTELPFADDTFDSVVSIFGVIFADDAQEAAAELLRVAKPGGPIVFTAWLPQGPLAALSKAIGAAVAEHIESDEEPPAHFDWSDRALLLELFGQRTEITEHTLKFTSTSAGAWAIQQATYHPMWLELRDTLDGEAYERLLDDVTDLLAAANEQPGSFQVTSSYVVVRTQA